jgi:hypothetical protein
MTDSNYIKLFSGNFIIVQQLRNELEEININPIIKDETESGRLAGFGSAISGQQEVFVHKDEAERAKEILELINSKL